MIAHRRSLLFLILGVFLTLLIYCFWQALFAGGQFGYRDAGHYYYPLYQRVQDEWQAGRWPPLWEPEENSGMPLLGNPTAAVLYPGKVIYALFPYAWAARLYVVAHVALAFGAMLCLMRSWRTSWEGSAISALTYAFGAPILFQYCNIIYLVGAAWLPLGFLAMDAWVRRGSSRALLGLAVVLAMQTLGGDPQVAYLLGLCGGGYAAGLAWGRRRSERGETGDENRPSRSMWKTGLLVLTVVLGLVIWVVATIALAEYFPIVRPKGKPTPALPWMIQMPRIVAAFWGIVGLACLFRFRRAGRWSPLGITLFGLACSAALAITLTAAQLLPVIEFTQLTVRAEGEGPHDIYPFSLEPQRLAELIWPSVLGTTHNGNAYWIDSFRLPGVRQKIWGPVYLGALATVLAAGAFSLRRGSLERRWLTAIVVLSLLGSLGQYTSPIWAARVLGTTMRLATPDIGPLDTNEMTPIRLDRYLRDGDGGIYWWMTTVLPGFRQFRFPVKLFTFTTLGIAALGGMGFDLAIRDRNRNARRIATCLLIISVGLLLVVFLKRQELLSAFKVRTESSGFGPLDPEHGYQVLVRGLAHGLIVLVLGLWILRLARRGSQSAGVIAMLCVAADLAVANGQFVKTVPQSLFEQDSEIVRLIREAEMDQPTAGPYRVHRMAQWNPPYWMSHASPDRVRDFVEWERATIQPKYGITQGIHYTHTMGVAELYDYEWFFGGFPYTVRGQTATSLGVTPGQKVVYFPRRSFDLWGSRYFVLPHFANGWNDEFRGFAAFLHETELVYPKPDQFQGDDPKQALTDWVEKNDFQIRRNLQSYPRAWVVHDARGLPKLEGKTRAERSGPMQEMLYDGDPIWKDPTMAYYDPRRGVWMDSQERVELRAFLGGQSPRPTETVRVEYPNSERVELEAHLESPGIVVLADVFYPGWKLTIDGQPATILQVNRLMRGAAVTAGTHRLVYTFEPRSFRIGAWMTLGGFGLLSLLTAAFFWRPPAPASWAVDIEADNPA